MLPEETEGLATFNFRISLMGRACPVLGLRGVGIIEVKKYLSNNFRQSHYGV